MGASKRWLLTAVLCVFLEQAAIAKTKFEYVNSFYFQSGHNGRQVADNSGDQDLIVDEPVIYVESKVGRNTTLFGSMLSDLWSSASEAIFDARTGASDVISGSAPVRNLRYRLGFDLGVAQKNGSWTFTPSAGYSYEYDYRSLHGGLRIDRGFAQDNFILSLAYSGFYDQTRPFDVTIPNFVGWENKMTHTIDLSASQILSSADVILIGYGFTRQDGFLAGTQNSVFLGPGRVSETMPSARNRNSITLRYVHGFNNFLSGHLDYRFYFDNWGILAHSVEPALYVAFAGDDGLVKVYTRFHIQNAATYFAETFATQRLYMTSDSDLDSFFVNEGGAMLAWKWHPKTGLFKSLGFSGATIYYRRSNDLWAGILQGSFTGEIR